MPQIVTDIKKPGAAIKEQPIFEEKKEKEETPRQARGKENRPQPIQKPEKVRREKTNNFFIAIILVFVFILGLGAYSYFFSVGATVTVWPKKEPLTQDIKLTVDQKTKDISIFAKIVPGTLFQEEKTISQEFQATGKGTKEGKAVGLIRIYNNYSTAAQSLVSNTRFVSSSGKLFRSTERVVVPGKSSVSGKLQPGSIDVKVIADQAGEDYNIGPSDFSIPGFSGTAKYTAFYGKSTETMKNGYKGQVAQVTQKDIDSARNLAMKKIFEETRNGLKAKITNDFVFPDNAIRDNIIETKLPKAGDVGKTFSVQVKGISDVLAIRNTDFYNFVDQNVLLQKTQEKVLYKESLKIDYTLDSSQMDLGKIILALKISVDMYIAVDEDKMKEQIAGVAPLQIKELMSTNPQIDKIEIKLLPPWAKAVPKDKGKISLKVSLTQ